MLVTGGPVWIEDVTTYPSSPRARGAVDIGVRAAFGVPVLVGADVEAVLEFFHVQPAPRDANLLELVEQVGTVLGRVIERERAKAALRETNLRLEETLRELQSAQEQVVQQERLRALGQMASGIAHDFNNALMPIVGYSQLLLDSPTLAGNSYAMRCLRTIFTAGTDAAAVVSRLREFYRPRRANEIELPVHLGDVARQVVDLTHPSWSTQALVRGIRIIVDTDLPDVPAILGLEAELRQAITNLVLNAIDALPEGGAILLRTRTTGAEVALDVLHHEGPARFGAWTWNRLRGRPAAQGTSRHRFSGRHRDNDDVELSGRRDLRCRDGAGAAAAAVAFSRARRRG